MQDDRILYLIALPIILVAVFAEYFYRKNESKNSLANLSSNLLCGLIDRLFFLFFGVIQFEAMTWLSEYAVFQTISNKLINALILFLIVDFVWYIYHRAAHKVELLWTFHNTHHQTDDFNLSLGLRVSFLQQIVRSFFWLPIALLGFEPITILIAIFFQSFYQFFIHTELFDLPKVMRRFFVSPKSHKLHHSNQENHLNKNFGGVLILWDKLFGTYQSAYIEKAIVLKSTNNSRNLSPLNAYFSPFLKWLSKKLNLHITGKKRQNAPSGSRLLTVFLVLLLPSLLLIFCTNLLTFNTISLLATLIIVLSFTAVHLITVKD